MPETTASPSNLSVEQKLDLLLWQGVQQSKILADIQENLVTVSNEQADFNADITALGAFLSNLPAQLTAIQTQLSEQGVTNIKQLDDLVTQANGLGPALASLPGGTPGTTPVVPPATGGPSASGTTPSAA